MPKLLSDGIGSPLRVVIAIPVLLLGGTEIQTLSLVKALRVTGFDVSVCCYYEHQEHMVRDIEAAGAEVILLGLSRDSGLFSLLTELVRFFKRAAPHVAHIQYIAPGLIPIVAARIAGMRTVFATVHQPGDRFGMKERLLFSMAARLCTAFFCVSRAVEESWFGESSMFGLDEANRGRRHFTIYNGVADAGRGDARGARSGRLKKELGLVGKRVIGMVARLGAEKGHALLFDALPRVLEAVPDAAILLVGDGLDREALAERARFLGIDSRIVWAGERSAEEVRELCGILDVLAVPSQFEGFGLSAVEAMLAARPVVATKVGGLIEIVENGVTGYLVPAGESAALAAALVSVLSDPAQAREMGARGRARALREFSFDRFSETTISAYRYFAC